MGWGAAVRIELDDAERSELRARARRRRIARADAMRAEIVLLAADGMTNLSIAERLGITRVTVAMWRRRFAAKRLDGLADEPRPGAPRTIGDAKIAGVQFNPHRGSPPHSRLPDQKRRSENHSLANMASYF